MAERDRDRERRLAREHYERQQARRATAAARRRRRSAVVAAVLAVALVVAGAAALTVLGGGDDEVTATPGDTPSAQPASPEPSGGRTTPAGSPCPAGTPATAATPERFPAAPEPTLDAAATYTAALVTSCGTVAVELLAKEAPKTVASFEFLAREGFFDSTACHRLTTEGIFVLQCGDPTGTGGGGPGYTIPLENAPPDGSYPPGTLAMARASEPDSGGSQFFLVYDDTTLPAPGYSVFGRVTKGLEVLARIAAGGVAGGKTDGAPGTPVVLESVSVKRSGGS